MLKEIGADIVALQEVASAAGAREFSARPRARDRVTTSSRACCGSVTARISATPCCRDIPVRASSTSTSPSRDYEPRGALDVCIDVGLAAPLRVIATHLGLRPGERREQVRRILAAVERDSPHPTLLMGDLNEWYLWGRPLRWLHAHFRETPAAPRTFPARRPVFALDRIWVSPTGSVRRLDAARHAARARRVRSPAARRRARDLMHRQRWRRWWLVTSAVRGRPCRQ